MRPLPGVRITASAREPELPSAIPAFIEGCGRLAGDAVETGEGEVASMLLALADEVAVRGER